LLAKVRGKRILDIGCGVGYFLYLNKQQGREVCGIEINKEIVEIGSKSFGNLNIHIADLDDIGNFSQNVDCISAIDVVEHIENDEEVLDKIFHALPDNGRLILVVPALPQLYGQRDKKAGHYRRYSRNVLKAKLESVGFEIIELRYWNFIAVLPYCISEKILKRELRSNLRHPENSAMKKMLNRYLNLWFKKVENQYNFGIGLSLICIAEKNPHTHKG